MQTPQELQPGSKEPCKQLNENIWFRGMPVSNAGAIACGQHAHWWVVGEGGWQEAGNGGTGTVLANCMRRNCSLTGGAGA